MINRSLYKILLEWKKSTLRLPLILRGARQVGKSTLVQEFAGEYDHFLEFNLERKADLQLFDDIGDLKKTIQLLFLTKGVVYDKKKDILLFIDEVQEKPEVIEALRYFHEDYPHLHVIATGSLLDFALTKVMRTPVGRVEYAELHPLSFIEYLTAEGNVVAQKALDNIPFNNDLLGPLYKLFHEYAMVGGMPKITAAYLANNKDITKVHSLYAGLIQAYKEDVEKYAKNNTQQLIIRHIMDTAPYEIDKRINLNNFGGSSFATREVKESMLALQNARLINLIYPTTHTAPPMVYDFKKRPRLHYLDIGLVNYQLGLHKELLTISDLHQSTRAKLVQQIVSQELKSRDHLPGYKTSFWVRDAGGTSSEVDIVYHYQNKLIPIEVKSGATGRLRSLHEYMDRCDHRFAVRIYSGQLTIDTLESRKGKAYFLLNLPYFLTFKMEAYLEWFESKVRNTLT